jgi:hypothetical protein
MGHLTKLTRPERGSKGRVSPKGFLPLFALPFPVRRSTMFAFPILSVHMLWANICNCLAGLACLIEMSQKNGRGKTTPHLLRSACIHTPSDHLAGDLGRFRFRYYHIRQRIRSWFCRLLSGVWYAKTLIRVLSCAFEDHIYKYM